MIFASSTLLMEIRKLGNIIFVDLKFSSTYASVRRFQLAWLATGDAPHSTFSRVSPVRFQLGRFEMNYAVAEFR